MRYPDGGAILIAAALLTILACDVRPPAPATVTAPAVWGVDPDPIIEIGARQAPDAPSLYRVSDVLALPGDSVLVVNGGSAELLLFDPRGRLARRIGQPGGGPGEYDRISGVLYVPPDSLFVFDSTRRRLTAVTMDGAVAFTSQVPIPESADALYRLAGRLTPNRLVLVPAANPALPARDPVSWATAPLLTYDRAREVSEDLGPEWRVEMLSQPPFAVRRPLGGTTATVVSGGRVYVSDAGGSTVAVHDSVGAVVGVFPWIRPRQTVTTKMWKAAVESASRTARTARQREARRRWYSQFQPPDSAPAIAAMRADPDGHLWVRNYRISEPSGPAVWSVLREDGTWLADVITPEGLHLYSATRDAILGVWKDEFGVEHVRVHALARPAAVTTAVRRGTTTP